MDVTDPRSDGAPATRTPAPPAAAASGPAATFLATEHWSLLGTRSMMWQESMTRTTIFLTVVSATLVALALTADASAFGTTFALVSLVVLPAVWLLGLATYVRLVHINISDVYLVLAMNRLRRAYLDAAPELAPYLTAGASDDEEGVIATYGLGHPAEASLVNFLLTTPTLVMTVDSAVAAGFSALLAARAGLATPGITVTAVVTFVVVWLLLLAVQVRPLGAIRRTLETRFPAAERPT